MAETKKNAKQPEALNGVPVPTSSAPTSVEPIEPEDAHLTGGKRSLQRRILGLNVPKGEGAAAGARGEGEQSPNTPAGQHATGSFTGTTGR